MENFCKYFDFQENLDLDDPLILSEKSLYNAIKLYGSAVILNGRCILSPDKPNNPCNWTKNTGKISVANDIIMAFKCKDYEK
ncbi:MAG: hypothetical protein MUP55_00785 [Candidatus Aenigmarchaeota archaeon]|nr:hypothetical protein [Candidatus Aenigmarchaeota archaeon]